MSIDCMGGFCKSRDSCWHHMNSGTRLIERLCLPGQQNAFVPMSSPPPFVPIGFKPEDLPEKVAP